MMGYAATKQRKSSVHQRQMYWMPHQVIDDYSRAAYAQSFVDRLCDLVRRQLMQENDGADQIKTGVTKGKCQDVAGHRPISVHQMGGGAIQQCNFKLDLVTH